MCWSFQFDIIIALRIENWKLLIQSHVHRGPTIAVSSPAHVSRCHNETGWGVWFLAICLQLVFLFNVLMKVSETSNELVVCWVTTLPNDGWCFVIGRFNDFLFFLQKRLPIFAGDGVHFYFDCLGFSAPQLPSGADGSLEIGTLIISIDMIAWFFWTAGKDWSPRHCSNFVARWAAGIMQMNWVFPIIGVI